MFPRHSAYLFFPLAPLSAFSLCCIRFLFSFLLSVPLQIKFCLRCILWFLKAVWVECCMLMAYGFESGSQLTMLFRLSPHHTGNGTMRVLLLVNLAPASPRPLVFESNPGRLSHAVFHFSTC